MDLKITRRHIGSIDGVARTVAAELGRDAVIHSVTIEDDRAGSGDFIVITKEEHREGHENCPSCDSANTSVALRKLIVCYSCGERFLGEVE